MWSCMYLLFVLFLFLNPVAMAAVGEVRGILVFSMNVLSPEHPGTDREIYKSQGSLFSLLPVRCRSVPQLFRHGRHHYRIRKMKSATESMSLNPRPGPDIRMSLRKCERVMKSLANCLESECHVLASLQRHQWHAWESPYLMIGKPCGKKGSILSSMALGDKVSIWWGLIDVHRGRERQDKPRKTWCSSW